MTEKNFYEFDTGDGVKHYFKKDLSDSDKYVVCTCAKNENDYIIEFIEHYINLGFDKIFICDNNDDESLLDIIQDYIDKNLVEVFDCRGFGSFQVQFYTMFCQEGNYKWCAYFDCDEFLELNVYNNIKDYLATKEDEICISFNWLMFGSNGKLHKTRDNIQERFPLPVSPVPLFTENVFIKSIVRGGDAFKNCSGFNGSHLPLIDGGYKRCIGGYNYETSDTHQFFPPRYKEAYLKHYYTKSFDEWLNKSRRGWPDGTPNLTVGNYFILGDWVDLDIKKMLLGLFSDETIETLNDADKTIYNTWDVIMFTNKSKWVYGYLLGVLRALYSTTNHTFLITGEHIDDTMYNFFLEMGFKTGNKVVWVNNYDEAWFSYLKYSKKEQGTYYIINL